MKTRLSIAIVLVVLCAILSAGAAGNARAQQEEGPGLDRNFNQIAYQGLEEVPHLAAAEPASEALIPSGPQVNVPWSQIAFQSDRYGNGWEIYLADGSGGNQVQLTGNTTPDIHARLNHGGTKIVYAARPSNNYNIYAINLDGSGVTQLTGNNKDDVYPAWSPDGTVIAFQAYRDGNPEIYLMNADGSNQIRLTDSKSYDGTPAWSPDGRIVFSSDRLGSGGIWVMNADGSGLAQLAGQPYSAYPAWSPDGNQIAYSADNDGDNWYEMWLMNADGSDQHQLLDLGYQAHAWVRSWSPDGSYIAYTQISYIYYQGNWYWTEAYLYAWDVQTGNALLIMSNDTEWHPDWQTTDGLPPTSSVNALAAQSPAMFTVSWSGYDEGPTGLKNYDVQVQDGAGGNWTDWTMATTDTQAAYQGLGGHTYYFRARARDNGGNWETWPASYDAMTRVETLPPYAHIQSLPTYLKQGSLIAWAGTDPGGSGISSYDVQYRDLAGGSWLDLTTSSPATSAYFYGTSGHTYSFRTRALDNAANQGLWSSENEGTSTIIYEWGIQGSVHDNAGVPVANAAVNTSPEALVEFPSDAQGYYAAYVLANAASYTATWSKPGYGSLPAAEFSHSQDDDFYVALPPPDNIIQDWGFEEANLSAFWQTGGIYTPTLVNNTHHTGQSALLLGVDPQGFSAPISISDGNYTRNAKPWVDANGSVHVIWEQGGNADEDLFYARRELNGNWSTPYNISSTEAGSTDAQIVMNSAGEIHVVWLESEWTDAKIFYAYRSSAGTWSSAEMLFEYGYGFGGYGKEPLQLVTTSNGSVYLLWAYNAQIYCLIRPLHQGWLAPEIVSYKPDMLFRDPRAAADSDGTIHVSAYTTDDFGGNESITYLQRDNTGVWSRPIYLTDDFDYNFNNTGDRYTLVDGSGRVQVLWVDIRDYDMHYVLRAPNGSWSAPVNISEDLDYWDGTDLNKDLTADEEGTIFLAWVGLDDGGIRNVFFSQHLVYQDWSTPTRISDSSTNIVYPISLMPDAQGNVHVTWTTYNMSGGIYYTLKKPGQAWSAPLFLSQPANGAYSPELAVGLDGGIHIVWTEASGNDMWIAYAGPVLVPGSGNSSLSQVITVPITMTNPTLSCLYRLEGASAANGSDFNVLVSNGLTTTLLSTSENTTGWAHAWFDLTPWLSQTITLTFNVHEVEGYSYAWAYLDEVTLGSANPDVWVSPLGAPTALPGDTLTFQLSYGNRSPMAGAISATITATLPSGLIFESASITPTLNGNTLTWSVGDLPADSGPFTIQVTASVAGGTTLGSYLTVPVVITAATPELELVNNQEDYVLYIGSRVYLPLTVR